MWKKEGYILFFEIFSFKDDIGLIFIYKVFFVVIWRKFVINMRKIDMRDGEKERDF